MKIDFSQPLVDFRDGKEMLFPTMVADAKPRTFTLGIAAGEALLTVDKDSANAMDNWMLAQKVYAGGEHEITPEEATRIKARIMQHYASDLVRGQCAKMLNG